MIYLHKPYIEQKNKKARLVFDIDIDDEKKQAWFEVDKEYEKYLCDDRVDAIFVGVLNYAMREGHDIKSDSYLTNDIYFKVTEYLIPSLIKYSSLHDIKIDIKTKKAPTNAGGVGTGLSCGIDSLHVVLTKKDLKDKDFALTHVCINNVGAFNECYEDDLDEVRKNAIARSKSLAKELKLPLIVTDSNFAEVIPQMHHKTHTYSSTFAILCLEKLWKVYYYGSSGIDFSYFNLKNNDEDDCCSYELLSLDCFSTKNLKIYSEGGALSRLEKTKDICKSKFFRKYLYVCTAKEENCGVCDKCMRTILSLYAIDKDLTPYKNIFDIDYFYQHKEEYYQFLYNNHVCKVAINEPTYNILIEEDEDFKKFMAQKELENPSMTEAEFYKQEYEKIANSKTFKVGNIIMSIPRKIKSVIKK